MATGWKAKYEEDLEVVENSLSNQLFSVGLCGLRICKDFVAPADWELMRCSSLARASYASMIIQM